MARPANPEPKVFCSDEATGAGSGVVPRDLLRARRRRAAARREEHQLPRGPERAGAGDGDAGRDPRPRHPARPGEAGDLELAVQHGQRAGDPQLETALSENLAGPRDWDPSRTSVSPFAYLERGRYVDYLAPWMSTFPDTSHVLFLEELLDDGTPARTTCGRRSGWHRTLAPRAGPTR